ncbi:MAG: phosphopentomutase [Lachnospiraceae bacterium]|nr:phosphopentomutase [Lachnospiraceae bacterium]
MRRFVLVVLDSFGVGAMDDCPVVRPGSVGQNTALHLIERKNLYLPTLEKLGIMNAIGKETGRMHFCPEANYAVSELAHFGADTFQGHQEIIGTKPKEPVFQSVLSHMDETEEDLKANGFRTKRYTKDGNTLLIVNDSVTVADNMESDPGQVINVSGTFDVSDFDTVVKIGRIVRRHYQTSRVIALGGENVPFSQMLDSVICRGEFIGLDTSKSGVYHQGYQCRHLGYGVDETKQAPHALREVGVTTYMYGKAADILINDHGVNFPGVETGYLLDGLIRDLGEVREKAFFCLNVQETDLAGHQCDPDAYAKALEISDEKLAVILRMLDDDDVMIVMADHGNDPYSGSNLHSRERVPVLIRNTAFTGKYFGVRKTMADVGQTVAHYFGTQLENGEAIF